MHRIELRKGDVPRPGFRARGYDEPRYYPSTPVKGRKLHPTGSPWNEACPGSAGRNPQDLQEEQLVAVQVEQPEEEAEER